MARRRDRRRGNSMPSQTRALPDVFAFLPPPALMRPPPGASTTDPVPPPPPPATPAVAPAARFVRPLSRRNHPSAPASNTSSAALPSAPVPPQQSSVTPSSSPSSSSSSASSTSSSSTCSSLPAPASAKSLSSSLPPPIPATNNPATSIPACENNHSALRNFMHNACNSDISACTTPLPALSDTVNTGRRHPHPPQQHPHSFQNFENYATAAATAAAWGASPANYYHLEPSVWAVAPASTRSLAPVLYTNTLPLSSQQPANPPNIPSPFLPTSPPQAGTLDYASFKLSANMTQSTSPLALSSPLIDSIDCPDTYSSPNPRELPHFSTFDLRTDSIHSPLPQQQPSAFACSPSVLSIPRPKRLPVDRARDDPSVNPLQHLPHTTGRPMTSPVGALTPSYRPNPIPAPFLHSREQFFSNGAVRQPHSHPRRMDTSPTSPGSRNLAGGDVNPPISVDCAPCHTDVSFPPSPALSAGSSLFAASDVCQLPSQHLIQNAHPPHRDQWSASPKIRQDGRPRVPRPTDRSTHDAVHDADSMTSVRGRTGPVADSFPLSYLSKTETATPVHPTSCPYPSSPSPSSPEVSATVLSAVSKKQTTLKVLSEHLLHTPTQVVECPVKATPLKSVARTMVSVNASVTSNPRPEPPKLGTGRFGKAVTVGSGCPPSLSRKSVSVRRAPGLSSGTGSGSRESSFLGCGFSGSAPVQDDANDDETGELHHELDKSGTSPSKRGHASALEWSLKPFATVRPAAVSFENGEESIGSVTDRLNYSHPTGNSEDLFAAGLSSSDLFSTTSSSERTVELSDAVRHMESCVRRRKLTRAHEIAREAAMSGLFSARQYNSLLDAFGKAGRLSDVENVFLEFDELGIQRDVATYSILISSYAKAGKIELAVQSFERMRADGVIPNAFTYSGLIEAYGRTGRLGDAQRAFRSMAENGVEANVVACNALIKVFVKRGRLAEAFALVDEMEKTENRKPDVVTYGTLIDACSKAHDADKAFEVFDRMCRNRVKPNRVCYASLIDACSKSRQPQRAFDVLRRMKNANTPPDIFAYNALIDACGRAKIVDRAFMVYEEILDVGLKPDKVTFNALISACGRARNPARAFEALDAMTRVHNITPDRHTYNSLIDACGKAERLDEALEVFDRMRRAGIRPCAVTYNALIDACGRAKKLDLAYEFIDDMYKERIRPDLYTLNTLIAVCGRCGDLERAFCMFYDMRRMSVSPDEVTYNTLIDCVGKHGDLERAWELLQEMQMQDLKPSRVTYNSIACACAKSRDAERALNVYSVMTEAGISLDSVTYSAIVDSCARGGRLTDALRLYWEMCKSCSEPWESVGPNLVTTCYRAGKVDAAASVFMSLAEHLRLRIDDRTRFALTQTVGPTARTLSNGEPC